MNGASGPSDMHGNAARRIRLRVCFRSSLKLRRDLPSSDYGMASETARQAGSLRLTRLRYASIYAKATT
jgi:hypothetical protein